MLSKNGLYEIQPITMSTYKHSCYKQEYIIAGAHEKSAGYGLLIIVRVLLCTLIIINKAGPARPRPKPWETWKVETLENHREEWTVRGTVGI